MPNQSRNEIEFVTEWETVVSLKSIGAGPREKQSTVNCSLTQNVGPFLSILK
jgi:hypothetical protein